MDDRILVTYSQWLLQIQTLSQLENVMLKLKPAGLYTDGNGKYYRKLATSEAAKATNPLNGEVTRGEGDKAKTVHAFYTEFNTPPKAEEKTGQ